MKEYNRPENWEDCDLNDYNACIECRHYDDCIYKDYHKFQSGCLTKLMVVALFSITLFIVVVAIFQLMGL